MHLHLPAAPDRPAHERPLPADEAQRLEALRGYAVLDTDAEPAFDDLTRLAAQICQTPIALISLVDESRQWFKSRLGLVATETPREVAFCARAILDKDHVFEVEDASLDARFADNPLVLDDPKARFYAGAPLLTRAGHALGTLCVLDQSPRAMSETQRAALQMLARQATGLIESRNQRSAHLRYEAALAQARDDVATAEAWQRAVLDSAEISIIATDPQFIIRTFNRAAERMLGYRADEVIGQATPQIFLDAEEIARRAAELTSELGRAIEPGMEVFVAKARDGPPEEREWSFFRRDGRRLPVRLTVTVMFDSGGQVSGYMGVAADLSERQLEQARFRAAVEHAPNGIVMVDQAGGIVLVNAQTERLFGYAPQELLGRPIETLVPRRSGAVHPAHVRAFFDRPQARLMGVGRDLFGRRKDGTEFAVEVGLSPVPTADGQRTLCAITDISERTRTEAQLRESHTTLERQATELEQARDRAEAADRIKSAFLATMSHELRTPLNSIIGFTGIMLQGLAGPLNDEQGVQMGKVRDSSRHLLALINDVLDISKIEAGQLEVGCEPFELRGSIDKATAIVRPLAEKKALALQVQVADGVWRARGDARRVEQVLLNLLSNAIKFTETGSVTLSAAPAAAGTLRIDVIDTGIGIAPADLATLFQPFRQIDSRLARQHEGTGLGLAIARKLAELMGGRIEVTSDPPKGSVFSLFLPGAEEAPP